MVGINQHVHTSSCSILDLMIKGFISCHWDFLYLLYCFLRTYCVYAGISVYVYVCIWFLFYMSDIKAYHHHHNQKSKDFLLSWSKPWPHVGWHRAVNVDFVCIWRAHSPAETPPHLLNFPSSFSLCSTFRCSFFKLVTVVNGKWSVFV